MPELPEVEVVRQDLHSYFAKDSCIQRIQFFRQDLRDPLPHRMAKILHGATVTRVLRRAKYIIIETDSGSAISHLGMTGSWRPVTAAHLSAHEHIHLEMKKGLILAYRDPRRFGYFDVCKDWRSHAKLVDLGVEPLDEAVDLALLFTKIRSRKSSIKSVIMDQAVIVGIGNIYASEALFCAGIRPQRSAHRLGEIEFRQLIQEVRRILRSAIAAGGSTISDFSHGKGEGRFQAQHLVYGRLGEQCLRCNDKIRNRVIGGRSSFWCPSCQH